MTVAGYDRERLRAMTDGGHGGPMLWSYMDKLDDPNPSTPGFFDDAPLRCGDFVLITRETVDADDGAAVMFGALRIVYRVRPQVVLGILGG